MKVGYLERRGWTRPEIAVWVVSLTFVVIMGILLITQVAGHWVLLLGGAIVLALGWMRYRAENEQKKRSADDQDE